MAHGRTAPPGDKSYSNPSKGCCNGQMWKKGVMTSYKAKRTGPWIRNFSLFCIDAKSIPLPDPEFALSRVLLRLAFNPPLICTEWPTPNSAQISSCDPIFKTFVEFSGHAFHPNTRLSSAALQGAGVDAMKCMRPGKSSEFRPEVALDNGVLLGRFR